MICNFITHKQILKKKKKLSGTNFNRFTIFNKFLFILFDTTNEIWLVSLVTVIHC